MKLAQGKYLLLYTFVILLFACGKEESPDPIDPPMVQPESGVLISNEGGFGFNNASLTYYQFSDQAISDALFENANGRKLGDVLQSVLFYKEQLYLVLNNSNKIEVVDAESFELTTTIDTFNSPRYLLPISENKAYVSELFAGIIHIVDLSQGRITGTITLEGWTEEMVLFQQKAFITNRESKYIFVVDTNTDLVIDSIQLAFNSSNILLDKNNRLWVYCSGDIDNNELGGLFLVDPTNHQIIRELRFEDFNVGAWPRMALNNSRDTLYYLKNDLFQLSIDGSNLPQQPVVNQMGRTFYALGIQPSTGDIFLGDAIDYQQKGLVFRYNSKGEELTQFRAGIIPNGFFFY